MPKLEVRREPDGVTVFVLTREAGPEDFMQALASFMRNAPTPLVLWDLRQGSFGRFTGDELRWMVSRLPKTASVERPGGRSAFVAREADHGVVGTFIRYAELTGYGVQLRVFSDADVARAWLHGRVPDA
jgi:hypothetical protein